MRPPSKWSVSKRGLELLPLHDEQTRFLVEVVDIYKYTWKNGGQGKKMGMMRTEQINTRKQ